MNVKRTGPDTYQVELSSDEIVTLQNCINEALELGKDFKTRVGVTQDEARQLWQAMEDAID